MLNVGAPTNPVHPRVCGEHPPVTATTNLRSPVHPRVCGEHGGNAIAEPGPPRSIPACAGNTVCRCCSCSHQRRSIPACAGNTHRAPNSRRAAQRSIPACAGNTFTVPPPMGVRPVHPRVCGEHAAEGREAQGARRSIPACAGNTRLSFWIPSEWSVHPRVCGEHASRPRFHPRRSTVHPRVCGEHGRMLVSLHLASRSIPACAGNTCSLLTAAFRLFGPSPRVRGTRLVLSQHPRLRSVHPRVCGEHCWAVVDQGASVGPSPRVRGTRESFI